MSKTHSTKSKAAKPVAKGKKASVSSKAKAAPRVAAKSSVASKSKPKKTSSKAAPVKKVTRPVAKTAPAKKQVKPASKKAAPKPVVKKAPAKPVVAKKPVAKKAVVKKTKATPKPVAKKVVPPKKVAPAKKVASPAPAPSKGSAAANSVPQPQASPPPAKKAAKSSKEQVQVIQQVTPRQPVMSDEKPVCIASGALFYDSHMHTPLCKHAWGEPEEYAAQGIKSGLKGIIFTCHCPMPDGFWPSVRMSDSEFGTYLELVDRAAQAYRGKLDVRLGLESEFFPGQEKWIERLHERADFDFILGGLHWQAKEYLSKFETGTIEGFRRSYFEHLAQSAETGLYDCLAHPDLVKNYHPDSWCFAIVKNSAAAALDRIAKTGVAMELNTSGLNKSYSEMNPGNEMLRMMAERKIPVVIGSDAHRPARVGEHFVTALNNLSEAGYEEVSYFVKRKRIDLKISEVLASIRKAADANF